MFLAKGSDQGLNLDLIVKAAQTDAAKAAKYHASNLIPPILKRGSNDSSIQPSVSLILNICICGNRKFFRYFLFFYFTIAPLNCFARL